MLFRKIGPRPARDDDGLFELMLGWILGFGAGLCLASLAAVFVIAFAPQWIPQPLLAILALR